MKDIHSVCPDIAKRIPYTSCSVHLPSKFDLISNINFVNQHEVGGSITNKIFGSDTRLSTKESEEKLETFVNVNFEAALNSNTDEYASVLGVSSRQGFSSESGDAHRNDDAENIRQEGHGVDKESALIAITNMPVEEVEKELESDAATNGHSSQIASLTNMSTFKPSSGSTESDDKGAHKPVNTPGIFTVDNYSSGFDKQSMPTSITKLPDHSEIESSTRDVSSNVQTSDDVWTSNNNNKASTQNNYEFTNQSNDVEKQTSSVTLGRSEKELDWLEDGKHSTTVRSSSSIKLPNESTDIDGYYDLDEHFDPHNQEVGMAITTLQAEKELTTFENRGSEEADNTLTPESLDESTNSYYDDHNNYIEKQSTLVVDETEEEFNYFETDSDASATDSYISDIESTTISNMLTVQPTDESSLDFDLDDNGNSLDTISTFTTITILNMETEQEPLHFNTEISDIPTTESSTSTAKHPDHVNDQQYNDLNTNTEGHSDKSTHTSENEVTKLLGIVETTPLSDQFNKNPDSEETSYSNIYDIFTVSSESFQYNTKISDSPKVESSTFFDDIESNTYPNQAIDREYNEFGTNTDDISEISTHMQIDENEATKSLDIVATTTSSDNFSHDSDNVKTSSQQSYGIFTETTGSFQFNTEISDSPEEETSTFIVDIESSTYPDQATDREYIDFDTNTGGISKISTESVDNVATTPSSDEFNRDSDNVENGSRPDDDDFVAAGSISPESTNDENKSVLEDEWEKITPISNCEHQLSDVITTDSTKDNIGRTTFETVTQNDVVSNTSSSVILETTSSDDNKLQTTLTSSLTNGGTTEQEKIDDAVHQNGGTEDKPDFGLTTESSNSFIKTSQSATATAIPHENDFYTNPNDIVEGGHASKVSSISTVDSIGTTEGNKNCDEDSSGPCFTGNKLNFHTISTHKYNACCFI